MPLGNLRACMIVGPRMNLGIRMKKFAVILLTATSLATPAFAITYPVSGRWGLSNETDPGPIDCEGKRVIRFDPYRRFDSGGGVPDYRVIDLVNEAETPCACRSTCDPSSPSSEAAGNGDAFSGVSSRCGGDSR